MNITLFKFKIYVAALASIAWTASAQQMNYQGRLTDATGAPLQDGQYTIAFELYTTPTGGAPAWGPFICDGGSGAGYGPKADLVNGRFNVLMGPNDTNDAPMFAVVSQARYLQITVLPNPPLLPRQQIFSSPIAMYSERAGHAAVADSLSGSAVNFTDLNVSGNLNLGGALNGVSVVAGNMSIPGTLTVNGNETLLGALNLPGATNGLGSIFGGNTLTLLGGGTSEAARRIETRGAVLMSPPNGTAAPAEFQTLSVNGKVTADVIIAQKLGNGSATWNLDQLLANSPPMIISTINLHDTERQQVLGDRNIGFNIKDYIDDTDGCRIRMTLIHKLSHEVRFMEANLAVAPKDLSRNPNTNQTHGFTVQNVNWSPSNETGELHWTFHDGVRQFLIDAWPGPWLRCLDFYPGSQIGQPADDVPPTDASKMQIWFHLHPHVAARIVILD